MIRFKSCPRCKGDVRLDRDYYGWYEECLQCGYMRDLESIVKEKRLVHERKKRLPRLH